MSQRSLKQGNTAEQKARYLVRGVAVALLLIFFRLWYLAVLSHDERLEEARRPQQKIVVESAQRGTIRDRYNIPLAINQIRYQATITYSQIQQLPSYTWEVTTDGARVKRYKRREYISKLAQLLARELTLDAKRVEDLIHSKAALYHHVPFVVKQELTEREYYRIRALEREWVGLSARCQPRRCYPQGRIAGDLIGYLGPIHRGEYEKILHDIAALREFFAEWDAGEAPPLPDGLSTLEEARSHLEVLEERAYGINDHIGKSGIEKSFETVLRGCCGKKIYYSDAKGNFLRELPGGVASKPGKRVLLSISAELQQFAEELLISNEAIRLARVSVPGSLERSKVSDKQPWIRGGAIVALDPNNGDLLAFASYPRFDPNDFIAIGNRQAELERQRNLNRWLETETHLADLWDGRVPLQREFLHSERGVVGEEQLWLEWHEYLRLVLPDNQDLRAAMESLASVKLAVKLQRAVLSLEEWLGCTGYPLFNLLYPEGCYGQKINGTVIDWNLAPAVFLEAKAVLDRFLGSITGNYDKVLFVDLCRLVIDEAAFDEELLAYCGTCTLGEQRHLARSTATLRSFVRQRARDFFNATTFVEWRSKYGESFLKAERALEREKKRYPQPYTDLLDKKEKELFEDFWVEKGDDLLTAVVLGNHPNHSGDPAWDRALDELKVAVAGMPFPIARAFFKSMRSYDSLTRPLLGRYRQLRRDQHGVQLEKHLAAAFYPTYGFGYGRSYCYRQATVQGSLFKLVTAYAALIRGALNPLSVIDNVEKRGRDIIVGYSTEGKAIPQHYKGGRIPKSLKRNIGLIDITKAIVYSSNLYFALLAGDILSSPDELIEAAKAFSFGSPTGVALPGEIGGKLPTDLHTNRTGLYATSIGQHTLVVTPLQSAVMLAALTNGGNVLCPKIVTMVVEPPDRLQLFPSEVKRSIPLSKEVSVLLIDAMRQVAKQTQQANLRSIRDVFHSFPSAIADYTTLGAEVVGKTSTAEALESLDLSNSAQIYNHLWFGGISFDDKKSSHLFLDAQGKPELVVVVHLRYGGYGKEVAPLAAQMVQKWRAIKKERGS